MEPSRFIVSYLTRLNPPENNADSDLGAPREIPSASDFGVIQCPEWCEWKPECNLRANTTTRRSHDRGLVLASHVTYLTFNGMHHHRRIARLRPLLGANGHKL
jgi:hypothetical protein